MNTGNQDGSRAIFKSIGDDGKCWLFVVLAGGRWAITCDGEQVAVGTTRHASISSGVEKYLSFTAAATPAVQSAFA